MPHPDCSQCEVLQAAERLLATGFEAMARLQKLGSVFVHDDNREQVLGEIVDVAITIASADFGNIQLINRTTGDLQIAAQRGFPKWWSDYWNSVCKGHGTCGTVLKRSERVIVEDVELSPIFVGTPALEIQRRAGVRAVQSTPLIGRSGGLFGIFSTHYRTPYRPDDYVLRLLDLLARQAADILERAQAEADIRGSEERLRTIIDTAVDAIIVIDDEGIIQSVNPATERIFGYTTGELVGHNVSTLMPEPDRSAHKHYISTFLHTGQAKIIGAGLLSNGASMESATSRAACATFPRAGSAMSRSRCCCARSITAPRTCWPWCKRLPSKRSCLQLSISLSASCNAFRRLLPAATSLLAANGREWGLGRWSGRSWRTLRTRSTRGSSLMARRCSSLPQPHNRSAWRCTN
jgi:PAS domain-containing protein